jgi:hypothetical protein
MSICPVQFDLSHRISVSAHGLCVSVHTDTDDIELEASLQQLLLDLLSNAVETDMAPGKDRIALVHRHGHGGTQILS